MFWQKKVWSLPEFDRGMRKAFEHRASKRLGQMFNEAQKQKKRPYWVSELLWERLGLLWSSPELIKMQQQRKQCKKI